MCHYLSALSFPIPSHPHFVSPANNISWEVTLPFVCRSHRFGNLVKDRVSTNFVAELRKQTPPSNKNNLDPIQG